MIGYVLRRRKSLVREFSIIDIYCRKEKDNGTKILEVWVGRVGEEGQKRLRLAK